MSYQALARKWRPKDFNTVIGQEHVIRALKNALELQRLHHAYLFSGTRGVGKTTLARVLVRCLNCETGITSTPCGSCTICTQIDQGSFIDLIEIDAASRTGVDDMRDLLDNVHYAPNMGRFKVYLIDEVHMLSINSFNALLKTLEEPPEHVKFLFATTNPKKLPITILSRCLQFNLTRLAPEEIEKYLITLLQAENVEYEEAAVRQIALLAEGSVRDSLSLLDQAIAYGNGSLKTQEVAAMLGLINSEHVSEVLQCIAQGNTQDLLACIEFLYVAAADFNSVLTDIIGLLNELAIYQIAPEASTDPRFKREDIVALADILTPEQVQLFYQISINGKRDIVYLPDMRKAFTMIMVRMISFKPITEDMISLANTTQGHTHAVIPSASVKSNSESQSSTVSTASTKTDNISQATSQISDFSKAEQWPELIDLLDVKGPAKQLCRNATLHINSNNSACLLIDKEHSDMLRTSSREKEVISAFQKIFGEQVSVEFVESEVEVETPHQEQNNKEIQLQTEAHETINKDNTVRALQESLGAELIPESIKPVK